MELNFQNHAFAYRFKSMYSENRKEECSPKTNDCKLCFREKIRRLDKRKSRSNPRRYDYYLLEKLT